MTVVKGASRANWREASEFESDNNVSTGAGTGELWVRGNV
jgi:hypothetical protein